MKEYLCAQGESEWLHARIGKVTASEAGELLTPEFKIRDGETPKTYLAKKAAETILNRPLEGFSSFATEEGEQLEMEARAWFGFNYPFKVRQVGFIEHDDGRCGCSPDGLLDEDGLLEIKAPQPTNHVKYLLTGTLPKEYAVQCHFQLFVTERPWLMFVSFRRRFKPFVLRVERDEKICAKIQECLTGFYGQLDVAMAKLRPI